MAFAAALLAYPAFLAWGYAPAVVAGRRLPLSVIGAGLNVLAWYAFAAWYVRARRGMAGPVSAPALRCWDLAVYFLVASTAGAWGLALLKPLGVENPALALALTHVFLDVFSEGWFVFGVLGLAFAEAPGGADRSRWFVRLAAVGVPFTFALGMPAALVPPPFGVLGRVGAVLVGAGLFAAGWTLRTARPGGLWRFALGALALKAGAGVAAGLGPGAWTALPGLRILYLHLMLLGFVTVGLVAAARTVWGDRATRGRAVFAAAVGGVLLSLVPLTALWPPGLGGRWPLVLAATLAFGPVLAAAGMLAAGRTTPGAPSGGRSRRPPEGRAGVLDGAGLPVGGRRRA